MVTTLRFPFGASLPTALSYVLWKQHELQQWARDSDWPISVLHFSGPSDLCGDGHTT